MKNTKKKTKSVINLFIDDFEVQNWKVLENTKLDLLPKSGIIFALYAFDFIFCHFIIGDYLIGFGFLTV